jgi:hypothetical protein
MKHPDPKWILSPVWRLAEDNPQSIRHIKKKFSVTRLRPYLKAAAIFAYCHGLIPTSVTTWIIQGGGLRHE